MTPAERLTAAAIAFRDARLSLREAMQAAQPGRVGAGDMDAAFDAEDRARQAATAARKALCDAAESLPDT
jgi:hypothetical protein